MPPVRIIRPTGILSTQAPYDAPFKEIDGRIGHYAAATIDYVGYGQYSMMYYDNRADDRAISGGQWAWDTSFWSFGLRTWLTEDIELLAQGMAGRATVITTSRGPFVGVDFRAACGLISKTWNNQRLSFRLDWFETEVNDPYPDANDEADQLPVLLVKSGILYGRARRSASFQQ